MSGNITIGSWQVEVNKKNRLISKIKMMKKIKCILMIFLISLVSCTEKKQEKFSFIQLCDTQLGFGGYEHDLKSFKTVVKQINSLKPDFVVICGDLVDKRSDNSYVDFKEIMRGFKMPCYNTPGNHDVGNIPTNATLNYYRKTIGKDYYNFQHKGYSFIMANTQLWKVDVENESKKYADWFEKTLKNESVNPIFIIGHYPLYVESLDEEESYHNLPLNRRKELLKLFEQNNVTAYLTGHTHKKVINNYKGIQLVSGEASSRNIDNSPLGFRVWKVSTDTIKQSFVLLEPITIEKEEK